MTPLDPAVLPPGLRARFVDDVNGLRVHLLEAGYDPPGRPLVLLLHGFPEIAYSWRKVMPRLAAAGYHAVAPDLRGYGRTTGWSADFDADLRRRRHLLADRRRHVVEQVHDIIGRHLRQFFGGPAGEPMRLVAFPVGALGGSRRAGNCARPVGNA